MDPSQEKNESLFARSDQGSEAIIAEFDQQHEEVKHLRGGKRIIEED